VLLLRLIQSAARRTRTSRTTFDPPVPSRRAGAAGSNMLLLTRVSAGRATRATDDGTQHRRRRVRIHPRRRRCRLPRHPLPSPTARSAAAAAAAVLLLKLQVLRLRRLLLLHWYVDLPDTSGHPPFGRRPARDPERPAVAVAAAAAAVTRQLALCIRLLVHRREHNSKLRRRTVLTVRARYGEHVSSRTVSSEETKPPREPSVVVVPPRMDGNVE
jgi:hypothetical protein